MGFLSHRRVGLPLLIVFIISLAFVLRIEGLGWDGGKFFHPDERSIYMRADCMYNTLADRPGWERCSNPEFPIDDPGIPSISTFLDPNRSPLNPHWFPLGSILIYMLVGIRWGLGLFMDQIRLEDLATAGRTLTVIIDSLTVIGIFGLGRRLFGTMVGVMSGTLVALSVSNIQLSLFYRPEPFTMLLWVAAIWCMLNVLEKRRLRDHVALAIVIGLTFGFRATSLSILLPVAVTYAVATKQALHYPDLALDKAHLRKLVGYPMIAGLVSAITFCILQPYALIDLSKFLSDLSWETDIARTAGQVPYTLQYVGTTSITYEIQQTMVWGLGIPLGVLAWAGLCFSLYRTMSRPRIGEALIVAGIVPTLAIAFYFEVKFLRYTAPVLPAMVLLGSAWIVSMYTWIKARNAFLARAGIIGSLIIVVAPTIVFSLAVVNTYKQDHPAIQASSWINAEISPDSILITDNHWDEGIPDLKLRNVIQLPMYEQDTLLKLKDLAWHLSNSDYLVAYSNRPFGSIARLPDRYPYSASYYHLLFEGALGYELEMSFTRYPSFAGISFGHDPFTRAGLAEPSSLPGLDRPTFHLGHADENAVNYDRPIVMIWRNQDRLSEQKIAQLILERGGELDTERLLLSPETQQRQLSEGTWSSLFTDRGINGRAPWLHWLLMIELIFLATIPLSMAVFRWLPDRGVVLARPLGILIVAWITWAGTSLGFWDFTRMSVVASIGILSLASCAIAFRTRRLISIRLRTHWRYFLSMEVLFLTAFAIFLLIRAANPDLWHPWRGGEKPMDLAYITAIVKSTHMPPFDPWYSGGFINYYYFGQFIVAAIIKLTRIAPQIAYNLAIPLIFALTITASFSIGHNLAELLRQRSFPYLSRYSPILAGLSTALLVAVLANIDGMVQIMGMTFNWITNISVPGFDYWRSSRMIPGQLSITEFPFWTFLFGDLHAHMIAIPFALLSVGLSINLVMSARSPIALSRRILPSLILALVIGSLAAINTWDVIGYGILAIVSIGLVCAFRGDRTRPIFLSQWVVGTIAFCTTAYLLFLPFHQNYDLPFGGIHLSEWRTSVWSYLSIHALAFYLVISWLLMTVYRRLRGDTQLWTWNSARFQIIPAGMLLATCIFMLATIVSLIIPDLREWSTICFLGGVAALVIGLSLGWITNRSNRETPLQLVILTMITLAISIGICVDMFVLGNDIDRMNTVFKFYLNAWIFLSIAAGFALWHLWASGLFRWQGQYNFPNRVWVGICIALILSSAVFPILGTRERIGDRFSDTDWTLDGSAYQYNAVYGDPGPYRNAGAQYSLSPDAMAIEHMRKTIHGSPVIVEAAIPQYRWGARISTYTGLPSIIGWEWHQVQQRGRAGEEPTHIYGRVSDVRTIYSTTNHEDLFALLDKYQVRYIYIGPTERLYYPAPGIKKFDALVGTALRRHYHSENVTVYEVTNP